MCQAARKFERVMGDLNAPSDRRKPTQINAMWFLRNGLAAYHKHPRFNDACAAALALANECR